MKLDEYYLDEENKINMGKANLNDIIDSYAMLGIIQAMFNDRNLAEVLLDELLEKTDGEIRTCSKGEKKLALTLGTENTADEITVMAIVVDNNIAQMQTIKLVQSHRGQVIYHKYDYCGYDYNKNIPLFI